jgi:hypothetical protein
LVEMKTVLAMLYGNFMVERVGEPTDVTERLAFTMHPVGLRVRLHRTLPRELEEVGQLRKQASV